MAAWAAALPLPLAEVLAVAAPRQLGAGLRIAALERRLRQDPTDLARRTAAVSHYSREATKLIEAGDRDLFREPLGQAREHLEYILKASNDIHRLHSVLGQALGARLFYQLPELTARYMRKIGLDRECMQEFDTRSEFEERATQYHLANALAVLKAAGQKEAAKELFEEAVQLKWNGRNPIRWTDVQQTPAVYIEGLEHRPVWEGDARPVLADLLESKWSDIREDIRELPGRRRSGPSLGGLLRARPAPGQQVPAYPNLVEESSSGVWDMLQLYSGKSWHPAACALLPRTSELLRAHLPSSDSPYVHYNTEEVVLFLLAPGSRVRLHNGGSNAPLNLHLGVSGCEGAHLEVAGAPRALQDGVAVCFDDGTDHRVWHDGPAERWVLTLRLMHPQLAQSPERYYVRARTRRTCFESWDAARQARLVSGAR